MYIQLTLHLRILLKFQCSFCYYLLKVTYVKSRDMQFVVNSVLIPKHV